MILYSIFSCNYHWDFQSCPKYVQQVKDGISVDFARGCCKQHCDCVSCREVWAKRKAKVCCQEHCIRPWTGWCIIRVPDGMCPDSALSWLRERAKSLMTYCSEAGIEFSAVLHPEKKPRGKLHWQGLFRIDRLVNTSKIRKFFLSYSRFVPSSLSDKQFSYHCGCQKQYKHTPVMFKTKRCNVMIGNAFSKSQEVLYREYQERVKWRCEPN